MSQKVMRFMGMKEILGFLEGETMHNTKQHIANTDSVGFCFTPIDNGESIYDIALHLSGVASMEVCLVGILNDYVDWREGYGVYSDNDPTTLLEPNKWQTKKWRELSTKRYSMDDFKEYNVYLPDMSESPWVWSGSWKNPKHVKGRSAKNAENSNSLSGKSPSYALGDAQAD